MGKEFTWIIIGFVLAIIGCFVIKWSLLAAAWIEGFALMAFKTSETISEETY